MSEDITILEAFILKNKKFYFSTEYSNILKAKIILEGIEAIHKVNAEKVPEHSFPPVGSTLKSIQMCDLFQEIGRIDDALVVLSIGSAHQEAQQYPPFVRDLCHQFDSGADIFNVDPEFTKVFGYTAGCTSGVGYMG